ncbi:inositol monophosphatase [Parasalinivibrio latis]|uniref:inositol monophosphatase family protein n=1 Tax=Parasalinivibrio latis TaxID=2952610 RepID=UPI0030E3DF04
MSSEVQQFSAPIQTRLALAKLVAKEAGKLALQYFSDLASLNIENKSGVHDVVSNADRESEQLIRERINQNFPVDGILGEELGYENEEADYVWVIDPIDGTQMFLSGIHSWCVSIAVVANGKPVIGVIYDAIHDECYFGSDGNGAYLNNRHLDMNNLHSLKDGMVGIGTNRPGSHKTVVAAIDHILAQGGQVVRSGSGALMLAQVAASKLVAYYEPRMYPWDCLAGFCLIKEANGVIVDYPLSEETVKSGGTVLVGTKSSMEDLLLNVKVTS